MMLLWLVFALVTVAVLGALLRPLSASRTYGATDQASADVAVYEAQLAELDADLARGLMQPAEAEFARREVVRRLLAASPEPSGATSTPAPALRPIAFALATLLPLLAITGYSLLGSPHMPAAPFASQKTSPADKTPVDVLIARVEARLAANPNDGQGWDVIAPVYFRQQRYAEAASAYARAAALLGETTPRLAGFAEATTLAANGIVTEPARLAYEKIAKAEPSRVEPRFWLALALEQDGKSAEAATAYRGLLADAPKDATWRSLVEERLAVVTGVAPPSPMPAVPRGPSADDMSAAAKMSDADRGQMIRGMVDGLAKRLDAEPNDLPGWQRLLQAYLVLGERDRAVTALADARRKLAGNPQALAELAKLATSLGLGS